MNPREKFAKAKVALLLEEPFFGALLLNLKCREEPGIATMATDGVSLLWSPKFVERLPLDQVRTVLAHEVMHCALLHQLRRGDRDPRGWNVAADHAVNLHLESCNEEATDKGRPEPFPFPEGLLKNPQYAGMSAEQIYALLPKKPQDDRKAGQGQGSGQGQPDPAGDPGDQDSDPGGMGEVLDAPGADDPAEAQEQEAKWKVALSQAATMAKMQGKLPGAMGRLVEDTLHPAQSWKDILRQFVRESCNDDYSWTRPNPRYIQSGFILPSLHSQRLGRLAVAIDTSMSIGADLLNRFMTEVETICHECRPVQIVIYDCDDGIHSITEYEPTDTLPKKFEGGGGTNFCPVFEHLDQGDAPVALIFFTDAYGKFPDEVPAYPVLWAVAGGAKHAPFGETIDID